MKEIGTGSFDVIGHLIVHHVTILKRRKHKIESTLEDTSIKLSTTPNNIVFKEVRQYQKRSTP